MTMAIFHDFPGLENGLPKWFSRLVRHPARKQSGSILTAPEPARGAPDVDYHAEFHCC